MTYRELLALYRTGQLSEEECQRVSADIERQEAIGDYLCEEAEIPELEELAGMDIPEEDNREFVSTIQRSIRRAFVKMGIIVGAAVILVMLATVFVLPHVVDLFYYNPNEVMATDGENEQITTERMQLDLAVYSDLFLPGYYHDNMIAEPEGWGSYRVTVFSSGHINGRSTQIGGRLTRNRLTLYDANRFRIPTGNAFILPGSSKTMNNFTDQNGEAIGPYGTREEVRAQLEQLSGEETYLAYVSLDGIMDYGDFIAWLEADPLLRDNSDIWCGVYAEDPTGYMLTDFVGFNLQPSGYCLNWDRETYPNLSLLDNSAPILSDPTDEGKMTEHFLSLVRYVRDYPEMGEMLQLQWAMGDPELIMEDIQQHGLRVYGFAFPANRDTLLELWDSQHLGYIYAERFK